MSGAKGRAASGFRPKLHSRTESLSLESLDMSRAVGRESLNIPKFGRESLDMGGENLDIRKFGRQSLDMGRESLCPNVRDPFQDFRDQILVCADFCDPCPDLRDQILVCPEFRGPRRDSCPHFPDSNSRRDCAIWV